MEFNPIAPERFFKKSAGVLISSGFITSLFFVVIYLIGPSFISSLNYKITDFIMAGSDQRPISGSLVIIDLDEKSLAKYGQWPWPRNKLGRILQKTKEEGAKSIVLDMILAEPDRTSPVRLQEDVRRDPGYNVDIQNIPASYDNHDSYLAEILAQGPFVLGYEFLFNPGLNDGKKQPHPLNVIRVKRNETNKADQYFEAFGVVNNLELFSDAVSFSGFLNATPDKDGILRRMPLLIKYKGEIFPSLSLAALMQFEERTSVQIRTEKNGSQVVQVGKKRIPIDHYGNILLDFNALAQPFPRVSVCDLLEGIFPKDTLRDKIVLIGSSASGLKPIFQTSGDPVFSHVAIHSHMLETLMSGVFPVRRENFPLWEGGGSLLLALLFSLFIVRTGVVSSGAVGSLVIFSLWFGARVVFQTTGYLFSPLLPTVIVVTEYAVLTIVKTRKGQHHAEASAGNALMRLKHSESTLDSIIRSIPDIIFRLNPSGEVIFVSPAITQYKSHVGELLGQPIYNLVAPKDRKKANYHMNERRTGERATHDLEIRLLLAKDGSGLEKESRFFSVSAQGIYEGDFPDNKVFIGTQGIIRDITEHKRLEERLLQAEKMEAVGNLAAGVAHDLNNILTGLVSYPDLLLLDLPEDSPLRKDMIIIQQSGYKAAAIVQDMVTLARRGVANREVFCPNRIILEYFDSPEFVKLKEKHPMIEFESIPNDELLNVNGSPIHLFKALMNLVTNAAEAMPSGGKIAVSSYNRYMDKTMQAYEEIPEGEYVCLSFEDNGVGISKDDLHKIFEPFYTKKKMGRSGTGLGMAIIWATVKDLCGYVDVKSKEGEGTIIDIYLPATRDSVEEEVHRVVLEDYLGTENIMVIADVLEQREIAINMLTKLGYHVSSADSGEIALGLIKDNPVELVILDMIMPNGMDGLDTYRNIMTLFPGQKAIVASGFSESDRVKELKKLGVSTYVQKPYTLEKIGVAVRAELDRK